MRISAYERGNLNLITACNRETYETKRTGGRRKIDFPPRTRQRHERSEGSEVPSPSGRGWFLASEKAAAAREVPGAATPTVGDHANL